MQGDARLRLFVLLRFGAGTRFPAFDAASLCGRGCKKKTPRAESRQNRCPLR
jgi:hypothetical protein